ncbi:MAG: MarR family winged helix-turn-helix transcriptional regulator [Bryobacteraceae bacterium]
MLEGQRHSFYRSLLRDEGPRYEGFDFDSSRVVLDLALTYDALHQVLGRYMADFGLSKSTYNVLMLLRNGPREGMQLHDLGEMLVVSRANITGLIDSLEERGCVKRLVHETDRRVRYAQITAVGEKLLDEFAPVHFKNLGILMQGLSAEDKDVLARLLGKMRHSLTSNANECARQNTGKRSKE